MGIKKIIIYLVLKFFSLFLVFTKINPKKITFVTLTSDTLTGDFALLAKKLEEEKKYKIEYILIKFKKNLLGDALYFLNCIRQLFVINTSALVIINDNNYVISNFKRKDVKVFQIWHACGAVKKFGNDIERQYPIANYDYVLCTSPQWKKAYARSFGVKESQVVPLGMPRTDELFQEDKLVELRNELVKKYPVLKGKYVILYAPTFRGNIIKGMRHESLDLEYVITRLPEDCVILSRMHPLLGNINLGEHERILNVNNEYLNSLLATADCFVSDYSSIIFDYSILEKKMVYYVPDLDSYKATIGLNIEYESLPGDICKSEDELINALRNRDFNKEDLKKLKNRYFLYQDGQSVDRIAEFINRLL